MFSLLTAGVQINNMQFGLGLFTNTTPGIMGIGYATNEATSNPYPNLVDQMVSQGLIASRTYSLYLNDLDSSSGTIIFGGVETQKFSGTLGTVPINQNSGAITAFTISLTGIGVTSSNCTTAVSPAMSYPVNVLLDSGTTFMNLPIAIADAIASVLGATADPFTFYDLPNCDLLSSNGSIDFEFSGVKISVPFNEFIIRDAAGCFLGMQSINSTCFGILGDSFLRSAYVVYDLVLFYSFLF